MVRHETVLSLLLLSMTCAFAGEARAAGESNAPAKKATAATKAKALRDRLAKPVSVENGIEAGTPLGEAFQFLSNRYDVTFLVDSQAFKVEGVEGIEKMPVTLPKMIGVKLSTVLRLLLAQVDATYLIRSDHIEITTWKRVRPEYWAAGVGGNFAPTVSLELDQCPLREALEELAAASGISIVLDSRASDQAKTLVTATLNNVPIDTAVLIVSDMAELRPVAMENILYVTGTQNAEYLQSRQQEQRSSAPGGQ